MREEFGKASWRRRGHSRIINRKKSPCKEKGKVREEFQVEVQPQHREIPVSLRAVAGGEVGGLAESGQRGRGRPGGPCMPAKEAWLSPVGEAAAAGRGRVRSLSQIFILEITG